MIQVIALLEVVTKAGLTVIYNTVAGRRTRMVVGFTTTYAISDFHH